MKSFWGKVLVLSFAMASGAHAQVRDNKAEKSMIIALENAWNQAQMHRDGEALN